MRGIEINEIAEAFWDEGTKRLKELRVYLEERMEKESVKFAPIYVEIIYKIDEILETKK